MCVLPLHVLGSQREVLSCVYFADDTSHTPTRGMRRKRLLAALKEIDEDRHPSDIPVVRTPCSKSSPLSSQDAFTVWCSTEYNILADKGKSVS